MMWRTCIKAFMALTLIPVAVFAGDMAPPAPPDDPASAMYTLKDVENRLDRGEEGTKRTGGFVEPGAEPASTMPNLDQIMDKLPQSDNTAGAKPEDVQKDKRFWSLRTDGTWGPKAGTAEDPASCDGDAQATDVLTGKTFSNSDGTGISGTMPDIGKQEITPGIDEKAINQGYHDGTGNVAGDADLTTGNIRSGVDIFGIPGKTEVVDTTSGDATEGDIANGKKAWVDGVEMTGSVTTQTLSDSTTTVAGGYYGSTTLDAIDPDLASANIKAGTTLFGITGDTNVVDTSSGDALNTEILSGKKAWVDGGEVKGTVAAGSDVNGDDGDKSFNIPAGLYSGSETATANDSDLIEGNIKEGVEIFGTTGTLKTPTSLNDFWERHEFEDTWYDNNDSCANATYIGTSPTDVSFRGTLDVDGDVDYFKFYGRDECSAVPSKRQEIEVFLRNLPDNYDLVLYRDLSACQSDTPIANDAENQGTSRSAGIAEETVYYKEVYDCHADLFFPQNIGDPWRGDSTGGCANWENTGHADNRCYDSGYYYLKIERGSGASSHYLDQYKLEIIWGLSQRH